MTHSHTVSVSVTIDLLECTDSRPATHLTQSTQRDCESPSVIVNCSVNVIVTHRVELTKYLVSELLHTQSHRLTLIVPLLVNMFCESVIYHYQLTSPAVL